ncbi:MAG: hypothetical protein K2R93_19115 [Gemmatimonadaceae bacterium]|nr:hypothetical protein [Gemmatimonadaceae bacterium]
MDDLSRIPTDTLQRMHAKVRTIMFALLGLDVVAVSAFAFLLIKPELRRIVPFLAPALLLPTLAIVPVVGRMGAISLELKKRDASGAS